MAMGPQQQYRLHLHTASAGESLSLKNLVHRQRPAPVHMGDGESPLVALARSIAARATIFLLGIEDVFENCREARKLSGPDARPRRDTQRFLLRTFSPSTISRCRAPLLPRAYRHIQQKLTV